MTTLDIHHELVDDCIGLGAGVTDSADGPENAPETGDDFENHDR